MSQFRRHLQLLRKKSFFLLGPHAARKGFLAKEELGNLSYKRLHARLQYWRSTHQHEVDFIISDDIAIEVKATKKVTAHDLKDLRYLEEEKIVKQFYLVSHDKIEAK